MNKIELGDKLFHAVKTNITLFDNDSEELAIDITRAKFKGIFETGFIMCRRDLLPKSGFHALSTRNFNEDDCVSFSRHISSLNNDSNYPGYIINSDTENAWYDYPFNYPSLVFDNSLLSINEEEKNCVRIPLEVQLRKSVELSKAIAISVPGSLSVNPFFENDILVENIMPDFKNKHRMKYDYMILKCILELTQEYDISLPIISSWSGLLYRDNKEYDEKVKKYIF